IGEPWVPPCPLLWVMPAEGAYLIDEKTPSWGIEPVPERLQVLGLLDMMLLWGNLSVSLLVIVLGALLVPALSLRDALIAIVVGAVAGNLLLGLAGLIGADARVPGMVVLRAPLGRRGSYAPTVVNVAQNLGWSTFELIVISTAAAALSKKAFGFEGRWLWALLFGFVAVALALLGPIGFVRRYVRKFAVWAVLASFIYLTWWVFDKSNLHAFWHARGQGGSSLGSGIDLVIGSIISWTPLAADYTRFSQSFLFLLGSVFVPLFGVLLADWLLAGAHYRERDFFSGPAVRPEQLAAWAAGFALYQWLSPQGPSWWIHFVAHLHPGHASWTASLPSF